jgi:hypothetical protein
LRPWLVCYTAWGRARVMMPHAHMPRRQSSNTNTKILLPWRISQKQHYHLGLRGNQLWSSLRKSRHHVRFAISIYTVAESQILRVTRLEFLQTHYQIREQEFLKDTVLAHKRTHLSEPIFYLSRYHTSH